MIIKRLFDVVLATLLLLGASPLILIGCFMIRLEDGDPLFFAQKRVGKGGAIFQLYKLRTMKVNNLSVEQVGAVDSSHPLVTRAGGILRRLKIDEMPQFYSVLRGDMSLIGPRPTVPELAAEYTEYEQLRLRAVPGLTGWAQVNGNIKLSWPERILLDNWYIDHWTLGLDIKIMLKTVNVVIRGEHINTEALGEAKQYADRINRSS